MGRGGTELRASISGIYYSLPLSRKVMATNIRHENQGFYSSFTLSGKALLVSIALLYTFECWEIQRGGGGGG